MLLKRERDLNNKETLLLDGWTKNDLELRAAYRLKKSLHDIDERSAGWAAIATYEAWSKSAVPGLHPVQ